MANSHFSRQTCLTCHSGTNIYNGKDCSVVFKFLSKSWQWDNEPVFTLLTNLTNCPCAFSTGPCPNVFSWKRPVSTVTLELLSISKCVFLYCGRERAQHTATEVDSRKQTKHKQMKSIKGCPSRGSNSKHPERKPHYLLACCRCGLI